MSKLLILTLLVTMLATEEGMASNTSQEEANNKTNIATISVKQINEQKQVSKEVDEKKKKDKKTINSRPQIEGIPLDEKLLDYIYKKSIENDLDYLLVLSIMKVESNFNPYVTSETNDVGLSQINRRTARWIANELSVSSYSLKNPYTSTDFSIFYLDYLSDKYKKMGMSEKDIYNHIIISYNRGESGGQKYIRKYGAKNNTYWKKVIKAKKELEANIQ